MKLRNLFTEERAVSPVIAVVLMIAVTVIMAAVVGGSALGVGGAASDTPRASFDLEFTEDIDVAGNDQLVITHEGGDPVAEARLDVLVDGAVEGSGAVWTGDPITTGESFTILDDNPGGKEYVDPGEEVRLRWSNDNGQTATLAVYEVPS